MGERNQELWLRAGFQAVVVGATGVDDLVHDFAHLIDFDRIGVEDEDGGHWHVPLVFSDAGRRVSETRGWDTRVVVRITGRCQTGASPDDVGLDSFGRIDRPDRRAMGICVGWYRPSDVLD